jgi:maleate isomerase
MAVLLGLDIGTTSTIGILVETDGAGVARDRPDAILTWSTNLPGWQVMATLEAELGLPAVDSAAAGVWGGLLALGLDPAPALGFGRIFGCRG